MTAASVASFVQATGCDHAEARHLLQHAQTIGQGIDEAILSHFERYSLTHRCQQSFSGQINTSTVPTPSKASRVFGSEITNSEIWAAKGSAHKQRATGVTLDDSKVMDFPLEGISPLFQFQPSACGDEPEFQLPDMQTGATLSSASAKKLSSPPALMFDGVIALPGSNYSQML